MGRGFFVGSALLLTSSLSLVHAEERNPFEGDEVAIPRRSKRENSAKESAAEPANPARMRSLYSLRILASGLLDDGVAEGDLTVARHDGFVTMANRQDRRRVKVVR